MRLWTILAVVIVGILSIAGAAPEMHAQSAVRLSYDRFEPVLPNDIRIQSADTIGTTALVVWGSTVADAGGTIRPVLYAQRVRGGQALDTPVVLTSSLARPTTLLSVLAIGGRFVVAWNDARDTAVRTYVARVGVTGPLASDEERLADDGPMEAPGLVWNLRPGGFDLLWNAGGVTRARACDAATRFVAAPRTLAAGTFARAIHPVADPTTLLLDIPNGGWRISRHGGAFQAYAVPAIGDIGDNGTFVVSDGALGVRVFATPDDTAPIRRLPRVDEPSSLFAEVDSDGVVHVYHSSVSTEFSGALARTYTNLHVWERHELPTRVWSSATIVFTLGIMDADRYTTAKADVTGTAVHWWGCDHHEVDTYTWVRGSTRYPNDPDVDRYFSSVDTFHILHARDRWWVGTTIDCHPTQPAFARRLPSIRTSDVRIAWGGDTTVLVAPIGQRHAGVIERTPSLALRDDSVIVTWLSMGYDSLATLGVWSLNDGTLRMFDSADLRSATRVGGATSSTTDMTFIVATDHDFVWVAYGSASVDAPPAAPTTTRHCLFRTVDSNGWRVLWDAGTMPTGISQAPRSAIRDPRTGNIMLALIEYGRTVNFASYNAVRVALIDTYGRRLWGIDTVKIPFGSGINVVPGLDTTFWVVYDTGLLTPYRGGTQIGSGEFSKTPSCFFRRRRNGKMLRVSAGANVVLDEIDSTARIVRSRRIVEFTAKLADIAVVENPVDSGIAVIVATPHGVRVSTFDRRLAPLISDAPVGTGADSTATPAAIFRHDSLIVVWQDFRNGASDIYGTSVSAPTVAAVGRSIERDAESGTLTVAIAPNPARGPVRVAWDGANTRGRIDVIITDVMGKIVTTFAVDAEDGSVDWDPTGVPVGLYFVSVSLGGRRAVGRIIVP